MPVFHYRGLRWNRIWKLHGQSGGGWKLDRKWLGIWYRYQSGRDRRWSCGKSLLELSGPPSAPFGAPVNF